MPNVAKLTQPRARGSDRKGWGNQEMAECFRAAELLRRAGVIVQMESGITDNGDPWCVFDRASEPPEVVLHLARADGRYLASGPSIGNQAGPSLRLLVDQFLARQR